MRALRVLVLIIFHAAAAAASVSATEYTVGDSTGWVLKYDYATWASDKSFVVGDELVFKYAAGQHNVVEVNASGFDSCSGDGAISTDASGHTTVALSTPGMHYFICSIPGHCAGGMKLQLSVAGSSSSAPPSSTSTDNTTTTTTNSTTNSAGSRLPVPELAMFLHMGVVLLKLGGF